MADEEILNPEVEEAPAPEVAKATTVPEIVLELTPTAQAVTDLLEPSPLEQSAVEVKYLEDNNLSPEELAMVKDFAKKIDITDSNIVLQYGASAQKKIAEFSDNALAGVRTKDLGEVGDMIANLVTELKGFNTDDEKKGLFGFLKKKATSLEQLKARYDQTESNVDKIANALVEHQNILTKDVVMLDKMYDSNLTYFKELTMYIMAGKQKIEEEKKRREAVEKPQTVPEEVSEPGISVVSLRPEVDENQSQETQSNLLSTRYLGYEIWGTLEQLKGLKGYMQEALMEYCEMEGMKYGAC